MAIQITRKKILLIASILVAVIAIAGSLIAWSYFQNQQSESTEVQSAARYEKGTRNIQEAKVENDDPSALVENYESEYYTVQQEISKTEPSKWDQATVNKAYFALEYEAKTKAYRLVVVSLDRLKIAEEAGINIDKNAINADKSYRDKLRTEASTALNGSGYVLE